VTGQNHHSVDAGPWAETKKRSYKQSVTNKKAFPQTDY
jgi:hypothetical protein